MCEPPALAGAVATSLHSRERRPDLWSEKTTVCRIFSCQRSPGGHIAPRNLRWLGALSPGPPSLTHSRGPKAPLRSFADISGSVGSVAARPTFLSYGSACIAASRAVLKLSAVPDFAPSALRRGRLLSTVVAGVTNLPTNNLTSLPSRSRAPARRRLVENTGLEPVTSWLQTRRSPS